MNKKLTLIFLSLIFGLGVSEAQTMKAYEEAAQEAVENKDFGSAAYYYWTMVEDAETSDIQHIFDAAEAARKYRSYRFAESWYIKVLDSEKKADYPTAWFGLGTVRKSLAKYELAKEAFTSYLSLNPNGVHAEQAQKEINDCDAILAMNIDFEKVDTSIIHLDERVNTTDSEVSPLRISDKLYYTSYRFKGEDKDPEYCCRFGKNLFSEKDAEGQPLEGVFNDSTKHTLNARMDSEQKRIYYNSCYNINASEVRCEILYRELDEKGSWGIPVRLSDEVNLDGYTATQPSVGVNGIDGKTYLFFASDRPDEEGKTDMDIWYSEMGDNGEFMTPRNLSSINTDGDDITPFYHAKANRLYFSSNGHPNMGGFDIYYTNYSSDGSYGNSGSWGEVEAMEYPVNSSYDEAFYSLSSGLSKRKAYFSSNRTGTFYRDTLSEFSCNDLFSYDAPIDLKVLTFNAVDSLTELDSCTVRLIDLTSGEEQEVTNLEGNNFEFLNLAADHEFMIIGNRGDYITGKGFIADTVLFNTSDTLSTANILKKLYLKPQITLQVFTYLKDKGNTCPLADVRVELYNITDEIVVVDSLLPLSTNTAFNEFIHRYLEIGKRYRITGTKELFAKQQVLVTELERDLSNYLRPQTITKELYFTNALVAFENHKIYFDNDVPGPRNNRDTISTSGYLGTYKTYTNSSRRTAFINKQKLADDKTKIKSFFDVRVDGGMRGLEQFAGELITHLNDQEVRIQLNFEGFASLRSNPVYNRALSKRRVDSVKKYLRNLKDENGNFTILRQAIDGNRLELFLKGYGSSTSKEKPGDDTIYSERASEERRVEIKNIVIFRNGVEILCPSNY